MKPIVAIVLAYTFISVQTLDFNNGLTLSTSRYYFNMMNVEKLQANLIRKEAPDSSLLRFIEGLGTCLGKQFFFTTPYPYYKTASSITLQIARMG